MDGTAISEEQSAARGKGTIASRIALERVGKTFHTPAGDFVALRDITLGFEAASFTAIVGRSGSGKTTLLHLLAGIDRPSAGSVRVASARLEDLDESGLAFWRRGAVGIVFQFFQLLPTSSSFPR